MYCDKLPRFIRPRPLLPKFLLIVCATIPCVIRKRGGETDGMLLNTSVFFARESQRTGFLQRARCLHSRWLVVRVMLQPASLNLYSFTGALRSDNRVVVLSRVSWRIAPSNADRSVDDHSDDNDNRSILLTENCSHIFSNLQSRKFNMANEKKSTGLKKK